MPPAVEAFMGALEEWKGKKPDEPRGSNIFGDDSENEDQIGKLANMKRTAKHVGVAARTLGVYHRKGKQVKSKASMLLSKHDVPQSKEEEEIKAEPCPKPEVKAEPCPKPQKQDPPITMEPESPPKMDNRQPSTYTILLSSHSCDLLNTSIVSSREDDANEYEEFPPTQLSEKGDVFSSLAEGHNAYREAAFAAPPSEEGAANNQVFKDMPNPFTGAKKPKKAPCRPKKEPSVCYMCDEAIP